MEMESTATVVPSRIDGSYFGKNRTLNIGLGGPDSFAQSFAAQAEVSTKLSESIFRRSILASKLGSYAVAEALSLNDCQKPAKVNEMIERTAGAPLTSVARWYHYAEQFGPGHAKTLEARKSVYKNSITLVLEYLIASGQYYESEASWDESQQDFCQDGWGYQKMSQSSLLTTANQHEFGRRQAENQLMHFLIQSKDDPIWNSHQMLVISPYCHGITDHETAASLGYNTDNQVAMIFLYGLEEGKLLKCQQVSMSSSDLEIYSEILRTSGYSQTAALDDIDIKNQYIFINKKDLSGGVIDVAKIIDSAKAQDEFFGGQNVFGETYEDVAKNSLKRYLCVEDYAKDLSDLLLSEYDYLRKLGSCEVNNYISRLVKQTVTSIVINQPEVRNVVSTEIQHLLKSPKSDSELFQAIYNQLPRVIACGFAEGSESTTTIVDNVTLNIYQSAKSQGLDIQLSDMSDFGKPKKGLCRNSDCLTRPNITDVGGCDLCIHCHVDHKRGRKQKSL